MSVRRCAELLVRAWIMALLGLCATAGFAQESVFSDVKYVPESGDRVGTAVCLKEVSNHITGVFAEVEGGEPVQAAVTGGRSGNSITFSGKNAFGSLSFKGVVQGNRLRGVLTRRIGTGPAREEKLNLPHVKPTPQTRTMCALEPGNDK